MGVWQAIRQKVIDVYVSATLQDPAVTARESFDFWSGKGAPMCSVWALLGDEMRETSFNWLGVGDVKTGGAHGVMQWHDARRQDIMKRTGIDVFDQKTTHLQQLEAAFYEMNHIPPYNKIWSRLLTAPSIDAACILLVVDYEKAKQSERDIGIQIGYAQSLQKLHPDWKMAA